MKKRQPFPQMLLGKLDICMQKTESRSLSFTLYKYQRTLRSDLKDLKIRHEKFEASAGKTRKTLAATGIIGKDFLSRSQMAQQLRERIDK
jgi:hypothetical protein